MATYKQVLKKYQSQMNELGLGEQSALLYLLELSNMESHNLYME